MQAQLNNANYKESDLVSIKIPLNLPYLTESTNFERVDGQIELNGIQYNYVKRRVINDSFELLCIPNYAACEIKNTYHQFLQSVVQSPQTQENKSGSAALLAKYFSFDYVVTDNNFYLKITQSLFLKRNYFHSLLLTPGYSLLPHQPPELLS